jgi:hypothetical protein
LRHECDPEPALGSRLIVEARKRSTSTICLFPSRDDDLLSESDFARARELRNFLTTYDSRTLVINPVDGAPSSLRPRIQESTRRLTGVA